jgi:putative oxygen-independent coproporphyrinogen III oxidase
MTDHATRPTTSPVSCATEAVAGNYFVAAYPPFSCWSTDGVSEVQRVLRKDTSNAPLGLYVHIPFCAKRCDYCYYLSFDDRHRDIDAYLDAVVAELATYARTPFIAGRTPEFVYFGGGTPSLLSAEQIESFLQRLKDVLSWTNVHEVTFECAPKTVTAEKLTILRDAGVTRLSLGAQQLDDDVLRANGRIHLTVDIARAFARARDVGFKVINLDLIAGLVGETDLTFFKSLNRVVELAPESVTIYQLEIPQNTPLFRNLCNLAPDQPIPEWSVKRERLKHAFAELERNGYHVSSAYAAVRDRNQHRFVYQASQYTGADLLGIGIASFSYLGGVHVQNNASFDTYLQTVGNGELPSWRAYALSDDDRLVREFVLQLKLGHVPADLFRDKFGANIGEHFVSPLRTLSEKGWLTVDDGGVTLTRDGLLQVDRMIPDFYASPFRGARYS